MIENIHREDLSPTEKGKFCLKIKKQMKLENNFEVSKLLKVSNHSVDDWVDNYNFTKNIPGVKNYSGNYKRIQRRRTVYD